MLNLKQIYHARSRIAPHVTYTPLVPAPSLSNSNREVRLKLETTQPIGAFKLRGAINAVSQLNDNQKQKGVVCASTGNHGRAIAFAATRLGAKATVCMSSLVPDNKVQAIRALGADIRIHGNSQDEAQQLVEQLVAEHDMTEIPPFDHADVVCGQGTIALELFETWPQVDTILIGLSGGGLLGGIALAANSINPDVRIIGLSPQRGAAMAASLSAGKETEVEELPTLADSLGGGIGTHNRYTFDLVKTYMDDLILLTEQQIANAMRHLYYQEALVSEGAGAVGVAPLIEPALLDQLKQPLGRNVAIIVSGKNVDMRDFTSIMRGDIPK
ncbi:MAG: hydroxyectoine utilization dehydratase EutB [Gammaproteobacteria bacterium]|nr:hydroxyectoine utilization dehydratase EutB [Gammaproteobacteria bacterium]